MSNMLEHDYRPYPNGEWNGSCQHCGRTAQFHTSVEIPAVISENGYVTTSDLYAMHNRNGSGISIEKLDEVITPAGLSGPLSRLPNPLHINQWIDAVHKNARDHGFYDDAPDPSEHPGSYIDRKVMLIVGELSEFHEHYRNGHAPHSWYINDDGKPDGPAIEIADVMIRLFDLIGYLNIQDFESLIQLKHQYNVHRPYKHGRQF